MFQNVKSVRPSRITIVPRSLLKLPFSSSALIILGTASSD